MECLHEFYSTYDDTSIRWNGADLLTRVVKRLVSNHSLEQLGLNIEPPFAFFPISSQDITRYTSVSSTNTSISYFPLLPLHTHMQCIHLRINVMEEVDLNEVFFHGTTMFMGQKDRNHMALILSLFI